MRTKPWLCLLLILFLSMIGAAAQAQTVVTYCDTYTGPLSGFSLTIPRYNLTTYPLMDATVLLDVTYAGQLVGENFDPVEPCNWAFAMNLRVNGQDLRGGAMSFGTQVTADGWLDAVGGADPHTVTVPFAGTIANDAVIPWNNMGGFYSNQTLSLTSSGLGGVSQMMGQGVFNWSFNITAQVCVTYRYDGAIEADNTSFGALKATYR